MKNEESGDEKKKKTEYITRAGMTVLTAVLIALFLWIMVLVGKIQGTARVVNYAGLVRGGTQRMVKLENAGDPQTDGRLFKRASGNADQLCGWICHGRGF